MIRAAGVPFDAGQLASYGFNFLALHCVLLVLAFAEARTLIASRTWSPWLFYLGISAVLALTAGKWGAGESYFLGTIAAACVLSAVWVARFYESLPSMRLRWALGSALFVQALLLSHTVVSAAVPWLPE